MLISIDVEEADLKKFAKYWAADFNDSSESRIARAIERSLPEPEVTITVPLSTAQAAAKKSLLHDVGYPVRKGTHYDILVVAARKALEQC